MHQQRGSLAPTDHITIAPNAINVQAATGQSTEEIGDEVMGRVGRELQLHTAGR
jgi:hypothetical protein